MSERRKVFFELNQDESGYPPVATESLWAIKTELAYEYILDNIPFFESMATLGDRIRVEEREERLWYCATLERAPNSLIRIVGLNGYDLVPVARKLEALGCQWELDAQHHLVALSVPGSVVERSRTVLDEHARSGNLDYEEAILR